LNTDDYALLEGALCGDETRSSGAVKKAAAKLKVEPLTTPEGAKALGHILKHDRRATALRRLASEGPKEVEELNCKEIFDALEKRISIQQATSTKPEAPKQPKREKTKIEMPKEIVETMKSAA
jgi:hypothetical protein